MKAEVFKNQVFRSAVILLTLTAISHSPLQAQLVNQYSFAQQAGTFTSLGTGATLLWNANGLDNQVSSAITIPTFYFNGNPYTSVYVSANGFLTFGSAPSGTNYAPIASPETYAGAVSAFGTDLTSRQGPGNSGTRDVRYQQVGDEFIVEWRQVRRKNLTEWFSFQIRVNTSTYGIKIVYGPLGQGPDAAVTLQPQMGLRGASNTFSSNIINRRVTAGNETWATTLPANQNNDLMRFTSTNPAKFFNEGQTYLFTPTAVNDCAGVPNGAAAIDDCGICSGGTTGLTPNATCADCEGTPNGTALEGTPCDDNDPFTTLDTWDENCVCLGTACSETLTLEMQTDGEGMQTSWEIISEGSEVQMCSGNGYPNNAVITVDCCVPEGCYLLRVYDSAGDGMASGTNGGYILRMAGAEGSRIIDNRRNFLNGSTSGIANDRSFCLPIGEDRLIFTSCDKLDWVNDQFLVASLNPAVSATWIDGAPNSLQDPNSGYQFWFFDPNGSYSFIWFRRHSNSHGFGEGAARAAHLRINNWISTYHIPEQVLMNVRVRGVVAGVPMEWGPACRFMIDPVAAQCPTTKLMDIPNHQYLSCGEYREFAFGSYVHARPVSGATQYQFRFRQPAEGYERIRTNSSYFTQLWWTDDPLVEGSQYEVDVRAYKNGQWCPWGEVCSLNIGSAMQSGAAQNALVTESGTTSPLASMLQLNVWPNPNQGDQISISISDIPKGVEVVVIDLFELTGKRAGSHTIPVNNGPMSMVLALDQQLANGVYLMNFTIGQEVHGKRLIVQH